MNNGIIIPETIFFSSLKNILALIRNDFAQNIETDTILYRSFNNTGALEKFNFYTQLKKIIITQPDDPRTFDFSLGFNMTRLTVPTMHITLPSENTGQNGMGLDVFDNQDIFENDAFRKQFTRRFDSAYNFTLTSDNSNEVIALYHFWRSVFIQLINHLELSNLEHIRINGGDIQLNPSLVPPNIFVRNLTLSFSYDLTVQELFSNLMLDKIIFAQNPPTIPPEEVDASDSFS